MALSKPLQFIKPTADGKLAIVEETAQMLSSIEDYVEVISVAGMFRSGKSYLLNRYCIHLITYFSSEEKMTFTPQGVILLYILCTC